jgi:hypothetical protein
MKVASTYDCVVNAKIGDEITLRWRYGVRPYGRDPGPFTGTVVGFQYGWPVIGTNEEYFIIGEAIDYQSETTISCSDKFKYYGNCGIHFDYIKIKKCRTTNTNLV